MDDRSLYLRRLVLESFEASNKGHVGPSMSLIEILRVLYDDYLNVSPANAEDLNRDRLILSKGHGCVALYALLADKGFIDRAELLTVGKAGSRLGGHPEARYVPGVEVSTGSLGHGLSVGVGLALSAHIAKRKNRVVVVTGDGELNEGSIWEAAMSGAHHRLSNLSVFVDHNKMQSYGDLNEVIAPEDLAAKWRAFGWAALEVDGHNLQDLREATQVLHTQDRPTAVICHTVKGRGLGLAENNWDWHFRFGFTESEMKNMKDDLKPKEVGNA